MIENPKIGQEVWFAEACNQRIHSAKLIALDEVEVSTRKYLYAKIEMDDGCRLGWPLKNLYASREELQKELEKKDINATLKQIKKLELGDFINENFERLSKLLIDKIVVKKSADKTRVILNIYINLFNITYIWDYNNFEKISSLCSHNENHDSNNCFRKRKFK